MHWKGQDILKPVFSFSKIIEDIARPILWLCMFFSTFLLSKSKCVLLFGSGTELISFVESKTTDLRGKHNTFVQTCVSSTLIRFYV